MMHNPLKLGNHIFLTFILLILCFKYSSAAQIGLKTEFSGGPALGFLYQKEISYNKSLNLSLTGFPGIILNIEPSLRINTFNSLPSYFRFGLPTYWLFSGDAKKKKIHGINIISGITRKKWLRPTFSIGFGIIYFPHFINPDFKDNFRNFFPVIPTVSIELLYPL